MKGARVLRLATLILLAGCFLVLGLLVRARRAAAIPVFGPAPAFVLTNSFGKAVSREDLLGRVWVVDFFFTTCPGICPVLSTNLAAAQAALPDGADVRLISITVNPDCDTPDVLNAYAARYGADADRWFFLTGPPEEIARLSREGFRLGSLEQPVFHSGRFVLVDRRARIRAYYDGTDARAVPALVRDIRRLLRERGP
jgi:protein SCO1/2